MSRQYKENLGTNADFEASIRKRKNNLLPEDYLRFVGLVTTDEVPTIASGAPYSHVQFTSDLRGVLADMERTVVAKNLAYGNSYATAPAMMKILYPDGITAAQLDNALLIVRILDKLKRIVTDNDPTGEDPWGDIAGYALLKLTTRGKQ